MHKTMHDWAQALARFRLNSIRSQVLALAVLAALVPLLVISVVAYEQNRRVFTEKITGELATASVLAGRETDVWLKERLYDLRVFASSYVVSDSLARGGKGRLGEYLGSVRARFSDYVELQLVDPKSRLIGSSARDPDPLRLPGDWQRALDASRSLVGEPYWDDATHRLIVTLAVPVEGPTGQVRGAIVAKTDLASLLQGLRLLGVGAQGRVYLTTIGGTLIADTRGETAPLQPLRLGRGAVEKLLETDGEVVAFSGFLSEDSLGSARRVSRAPWLAIAAITTREAYGRVAGLRNFFLLVGASMLLLAILAAYRFAVLIVRPLALLTGAAQKVSAGDLSVELPQGGSAEVANLSQVFNTMVGSLRGHHSEMERLSTTDGLTGLANRRRMMELLQGEYRRAQRAGRPFALLMLDVDHFKKFNDDYGHQAGDEVLARIGTILRDNVRAYDCAARYGGEEFCVILSGMTDDAAKLVAERIRKRVRGERFTIGAVTLSIGIAEFPGDADSPEKVIGRADAALYEAKRAGRDRVVSARAARTSGGAGGKAKRDTDA